MIEVKDTILPGVKLITTTFFDDFRGEYFELYNKEEYKKKGVDVDFIEDDVSIATRHVLKGIHGDDCTTKLVSCLYGKFYLIVMNYNYDSEYFGKWQGFTLSDAKKTQILIPPKYGNGHVCLSDVSLFHYKQTHYYDISRQFSIKWDDERFNLWWPIKNPIVSRRDEIGDKNLVEK